jgi:RNA polymerase sigma-70 factor (ECF subfamily)
MVMDDQVVERLRAGDAPTYCTLIERLQHPLTGYLHRLVGDREVALDLAQDTFLQVYKEIGKTSGELKLDAWIYRIATNYGLRYLNRKRLRQMIHIDGPDADGLNDSLTTAGPEDQSVTRIVVQQALGRMNPKDAAILQLHYGNSFSYEEIGHILKMSSEAVRKRVARGVEKFRAVYGEASPAPAQNVGPQFIGVRRDGR